MQSDLLVWIVPAALDPPAGLGCEGGRGVRGVFDAVFGDPGVALAEEPGFTAQVHSLILPAHQGHFDALLLGLPAGPIAELRGIGIALEVAVEPVQQVVGEGGGHAGGIVVGGLHQGRLEPALMEASYDDAAGVSAAFAHNLLNRLNRDLQGDADPTQFRYRARWQPQQQRIEMALVSRQDQTVHLGGEAWFFRQGDTWITEHSVKYSPNAAASLAAQAGWRIQRCWNDPNQQIALHLLLPAN